jgi:hypothetical protein
VLETGKAKNFVSTFTINEDKLTYAVNIYPNENGISVLMTDFTKQKKAEVEMLELIEDLQDKSKNLRQLVHTTSNDLSQTITRILGLVNLYKINKDFKINDRSLMDNVTDELTNLDNVAKNLSTFTSLEDERNQNAKPTVNNFKNTFSINNYPYMTN